MGDRPPCREGGAISIWTGVGASDAAGSITGGLAICHAAAKIGRSFSGSGAGRAPPAEDHVLLSEGAEWLSVLRGRGEVNSTCPVSYCQTAEEGVLIPFAVKNLLNIERDILTAPSAGGGPTQSHQLAFRNPLH